MERIDENQFLADPRAALEQARASGEALEIVKDGRTVARLIPAPPPRRVLPGGSKAVLSLTDPADTLDELLTEEDVQAWYPQTSPAE
jgi:antitoxin (DNA-binding transcriptional repressor) of toxin-antitoxin stability system